MKKVNGKCKLCQKDGQPLCHSHIIPEFFYKPTYDDQHEFIAISNHPGHKPKPFPKGFRESLLCDDCEGQLSIYETYTANLLRRPGDKFGPRDKVVRIPNFDYHKLKLFGLSLIWRCHVAQRPLFKGVDLGPHAEKIRQLIVTKQPGTPSEYPFAIIKIAGATSASRVMHTPSATRLNGHNAYLFLGYGYEWIFVISSHSAELPKNHPFVGMKSDLEILLYHRSQQDFLQEMRRRMGNLIDKP